MGCEDKEAPSRVQSSPESFCHHIWHQHIVSQVGEVQRVKLEVTQEGEGGEGIRVQLVICQALGHEVTPTWLLPASSLLPSAMSR